MLVMRVKHDSQGSTSTCKNSIAVYLTSLSTDFGGTSQACFFFQSNDILCDQAATGIKNHNKLQTRWLKRLKLFCFEEVNFKMNKNNKLEDNFWRGNVPWSCQFNLFNYLNYSNWKLFKLFKLKIRIIKKVWNNNLNFKMKICLLQWDFIWNW